MSELNVDEIAKSVYEARSGTLHLEWVVDAYWGLVAENTILPQVKAIHQELVKKNHTEEKPFRHNDADNIAFFIPQEDNKLVLIDHGGESRNFLYVIKTESKKNYDTNKYEETSAIHIRRYWDKFDKEKTWEPKEECADDKKQYPSRPSLDLYKEINFEINYDGSKKSKLRCYGDFRDNGYILSYNNYHLNYFKKENRGVHVEGSTYSFHDIALIGSCFLPSLASSLEIEVPDLNYR